MKTSTWATRIFIVVGLIICLGLGAYLVISPSEQKAVAKSDNPIAQVTKPKVAETTTTTETTLPVPQLPQPQDSPKNPYEKVPVNKYGTIEIPKISVAAEVYEGVSLTVLNVGPGHWPGTADAGGYGNMVIAGHRVTHSKPFRNIDKLNPGDEIIVTTSDGRFTYKVSGHDIVYPKDIWIVDQTPGYRLTLFACHPPGSAAQRYVIYADLVDPPVL